MPAFGWWPVPAGGNFSLAFQRIASAHKKKHSRFYCTQAFSHRFSSNIEWMENERAYICIHTMYDVKHLYLKYKTLHARILWSNEMYGLQAWSVRNKNQETIRDVPND